MKSNILVIGGNGKTGRKVVKRLQSRGQNVRIGSRSQYPAFDWKDYATFSPALKGIDKAYIVYSPDLAVPGAKEAIAALTEVAKDAKLEKVVLLSGKGEREAELCEQIVAHSGLSYTLVRASWFNQNFSESFFVDPILAGHVALPMAEAKIPFIDTTDIADVVVEALMNSEHNGKLYELTGPRGITFREMVAEIAKASGREITFQAISMEAYVKQLQALQIPSDIIWLLNYLFTEVIGNPSISTVTSDIEKVLGRKAIDVKDFVRETAKTGVWNQPSAQPI